jgi:hypothetical protein
VTAHFDNRHDNLRHACRIADQGVALEFGVHSGRTLEILQDHHDGPVIGFDSFKGLPETWRPGFEKGHFATTRIPVMKNTAVVVGTFEDTLPGVLDYLDRPVTLVHFDADLYSSTKYALDEVAPYLGDRCIFVFDEYFNYPGWEQHERRAFHEWRATHDIFRINKISDVPSHQQVTFEIVRR